MAETRLDFGGDGAFTLHITPQSVWLNTQVGDYDGICIGTGDSARAAVGDAIVTLETALRRLKQHARETKGPVTP